MLVARSSGGMYKEVKKKKNKNKSSSKANNTRQRGAKVTDKKIKIKINK